MATAGDIVDGAYRLCGILLPTEAERTRGLEVLNELIALWSAERLMVPVVVEETFTLTVGQAIYTIGSGGTVRPMRIESAMIRDAENIDWPVDVTMSRDEYVRIADKDVQTRPERLYYSPEFPNGRIHLDVEPDAAYTMKLWTWKPLTSFADLDTTQISMPAEYIKTLRLHLAVDLAPELSVALNPTVIQQAIASQVSLRNFNKGMVSPVVHDAMILKQLWR